MIRHFTHQHPLELWKPSYCYFPFHYNECHLCRRICDESDQILRCSWSFCGYFMHKSCAQFKLQILHPFHPQHKLILIKDAEGYSSRCRVCRDRPLNYAYHYYCEECDYTLDLKCAALKPIGLHENLIGHEHPLVLCDKPKGNHYHYACCFCGEKFEDYDRVYFCKECPGLLHESCAALLSQSEIRHPFHPEHPLNLLLVECCRCDVCGKRIYDERLVYRCLLCGFSMDVHCITLKPTAENIDTNQRHLPIAHPHPHPLIQCDPIKNFRRRCSGCNLPFEDLIYACFECGILHKSCAELPPEIVHPLHPEHPLVLDKDEFFGCRGCKRHLDGLVYKCKECEFDLDLQCARSNPHFIMISQVHRHALAYFDFETEKMRCRICREFCNEFFFRCVECDYNIHDHCYPLLPQTLKHECHCDTLVLNRSRIQELPDVDEETEFYCYACEELRIVSDPTYHCADCTFIAHVHCVISEVLLYLEKESIALAAKDESTKLEKSTETVSRGETQLENSRKTDSKDKAADATFLSVNEAATATPEVKEPKVDPVLHELDEKIAALEIEGDRITKDIARLKQRRAQHIASGVNP